jgi:alpha/beta hydrolase family protein
MTLNVQASHRASVVLTGLSLVLVLLAWGTSVHARVTRIVIDKVEAIAGQAGWEQLTGRAWGTLDPRDPHNAEITDLEVAHHRRHHGDDDDDHEDGDQRDRGDGHHGKHARDKAEYIASFVIRKPTAQNLSVVSGLMWHDVPNRGGNVAFTPDLFAVGDVHLLSGWQGDNAGATALPANVDCLPTAVPACTAPVFNNHYVKTPVLTGVTGKILARIVNRSGLDGQPLNVMGNPIPYFPVDSTDNSGAMLTTHIHETINGTITVGETIPNSEWKFCGGDTFATPLRVTTLPVKVCMKNGFDPAKLYQLVYTVKDPYVLGAGTAAFRDVASFFRYEAHDDQGTPNPLAGLIKWAIIRGSSQSGNFTRHFIHLGMNEDEAGRIVHDGAWPLIAGRRVANNSRWGQPDGVLELYQMGSEGPQWWTRWPDSVRHLPTRGILDRCGHSKTCPKIVETFGGAEVFALKMTTSWVGTSADRDIPLPANVRRYYLPSSTHGGGNGTTTESPANVGASCPGNNWGTGTLRANPVPATGLVNRVRAALREWVMLGTPPPSSQWPTLKDGTLVDPTKAAMGFPSNVPGIPDSMFLRENFIFPVFDYDWGPDYDHSEAAGVPTNMPPPIEHVIKMKVPRVDADGNEVGGVPTVQRDAPLGTYLGWNITSSGFHAGQVCNYVGGMVPFFKTKAQRQAAGDPRLSLEERYNNSHAGYVAAVTAAANNAYNKGYLLAADRDALIAQAGASDVCNKAGDGGKCNPLAP